MTVTVYVLADLAGMFDYLLLYRDGPAQMISPEFESFPQSQQQTILFLQLVSAVMWVVIQFIFVVAISLLALAVLVSVAFAVGELRLALQMPIDTDWSLED